MGASRFDYPLNWFGNIFQGEGGVLVQGLLLCGSDVGGGGDDSHGSGDGRGGSRGGGGGGADGDDDDPLPLCSRSSGPLIKLMWVRVAVGGIAARVGCATTEPHQHRHRQPRFTRCFFLVVLILTTVFSFLFFLCLFICAFFLCFRYGVFVFAFRFFFFFFGLFVVILHTGRRAGHIQHVQQGHGVPRRHDLTALPRHGLPEEEGARTPRSGAESPICKGALNAHRACKNKLCTHP